MIGHTIYIGALAGMCIFVVCFYFVVNHRNKRSLEGLES